MCFYKCKVLENQRGVVVPESDKIIKTSGFPKAFKEDTRDFIKKATPEEREQLAETLSTVDAGRYWRI